MPARYHLRFQIAPGHEAERHATELALFCGQTGVEEVVLLLAAEEFHTGHPTAAEEKILYESLSLTATTLRDAGTTVSLNPWVTTGHADRGRRDRHGFAPMVAPDGTAARAQASFACPRWRSWLTAHYSRFAPLGFRVLWLEDDFRYHNHAPLTWGGGFEPLMLERFARLAGEHVTREQLVSAVTAPGAPHPWRALLQQTWRDAQLEVAALVAACVDQHSQGRSRLGLMSSVPGAHSVEGRDWARLFDALSIGGEAVQRPHFAPYSDAPARALSSGIWLLEEQRAMRPAHVRSEPEIENWPHTAWSKSDTQTWSEMVAAQLSGPDALLLNLHPTHSGRAGRHPRIADLLRRARPALDLVHSRTARTRGTAGVSLVVRPDAAAHTRTHRSGHIDDLTLHTAPYADFLLRNGIPVTAEHAPTAALFGPTAHAVDDDDLHRLLAGGLLLDGTAAHILTRRGYAPLIGVTAAELVDREHGSYAYETTPDEDHLYSVNTQPALAHLQPHPDTALLTTIHTPDGHTWGTGRTLHTNRLGGRVAVLAATRPDQLPYGDDHQHHLHGVIRALEGPQPALPLISGGPHLIPHLLRTPTGHHLAVANGSADPATPRIATPDQLPAEAHLLTPLAEPRTVPTVEATLPHHGWLLLDLRPHPDTHTTSRRRAG
ncbi:hypothetical protein [Streptomyces sp. NPDC052225]|uniref:hypothetical protein n=1 Tax=Streptomyces sp. NPDC052225 TaxID=3154949 RepID=UPI0034165414